jgi:hypothetical protein
MIWIAPSEKDTATNSLEKRLFDAADQFRANSGLKPQEYSSPILGLKAYAETQLVEQSAIGLFAELGWATVSALEETIGATGTLLRESKGEVVLVSRLRAALKRLNPALTPEANNAAVDELTRDLLLPRLLSGQVTLASVSANGAPLYQPGASPQAATHKYQEG